MKNLFTTFAKVLVASAIVLGSFSCEKEDDVEPTPQPSTTTTTSGGTSTTTNIDSTTTTTTTTTDTDGTVVVITNTSPTIDATVSLVYILFLTTLDKFPPTCL